MATLEYRPQVRSVQVSSDFRKKVLNKLWPKGNFETPQLINQDWFLYFEGLKDAGYLDAELILDALRTNPEGLIFSLDK